MSNNLLERPFSPMQTFPLRVLLCEQCHLSQLSVVIDPEVLFGHYVYRSSISEGYRLHCQAMAVDLERFGVARSGTYHIDIAGNDGALLNEFKKLWGHHVLNIDPAENLAAISRSKDIPTLPAFWGYAAARRVTRAVGRVGLITATNVFAHVDNVTEFMDAIKQTLRLGGIAVLEFPYLRDFIDKKEFDTVYFEHLSYFSIAPLKKLCDKVGLELIDVTHHDIHGGSVRCIIGHPDTHPVTENVERYINAEKANGFHDIVTYHLWAKKVKVIIEEFANNMDELSSKAKVYGFAASAKGNVLLNCSGITGQQMNFIVDQTPEKIGKFSPGTGIEIISLETMLLDPPDYLILLSWNFGKEIIAKCRTAGYTGKFIYPLTWMTAPSEISSNKLNA